LISLWNLVKTRPAYLAEEYLNRWLEYYDKGDSYYFEIRDRFNLSKDACDFLFLTRTSFNGLIRYNGKGEFNSSVNYKTNGVNPQAFAETLLAWHSLVKHVDFKCCDYRDIYPAEGDFVFLDPPYYNTDSMYYGEIDLDSFWDWMRSLPCAYILSFNGLRGNEAKTYNVPNDLYDEHIYLGEKLSSLSYRATGKSVYVRESLYIKY
jgi:DNA adenine methylase